MSLRIAFDLSDSDLEHFRLIMREARKAASEKSEAEIIAAAESLLDEVKAAENVPEFISDRLSKLKVMTDMLSDAEWKLPEEETTRVLNALVYFGEPEDLIPDHIPGLGFLDDAIMVELVVRELKHEIEAYQDFCEFRSRIEITGKAGDEVTREEWLASRRKELHSRMRRRRKKRRGRGGSSKSPFSLF
jgi:uncharacterized membrane protein YkvA (DUF1232 family)